MLRATGTMLLISLEGRTLGHGAMVHPRSRNSIDAFVVPPADQKGWGFKGECANISGGACRNGQSAFWYSQGCFIGCPECDHVSGRRQTDLCKLGFVGQLPTHAIAVINGNFDINFSRALLPTPPDPTRAACCALRGAHC